MSNTVIVGAGVAGVRTALELRNRGYCGTVTLIGDESEEPYDRPPLSKEFLKGAVEKDALGLLPSHTAEERQIAVRSGVRVHHIDREQRRVQLASGDALTYDHLVLATGAHNRELFSPGVGLAGVWSLRTVAEADGLRTALANAEEVVVVGGGFIGLEVAAAARGRGAHVTVVEFLPRVMARALSPEMSAHFATLHATHGVAVKCGAAVKEIVGSPDGAVESVLLSDGTTLPAQLVVIGVGVQPSDDLASASGLRTADGVLVDSQLRTSDPRIFAVGDCARFDCTVSQREVRLESIQNATDQARFVASQIAAASASEPTPDADANYRALPWFWTEQFSAKLQIAGSAPAEAESVLRGDPASGSFSVCRFVSQRLVAVESVNNTKDHLGARKLLSADSGALSRVTRSAVADTGTALKSLLDG
jgi:3-phenylpropionate/trans-cinnamate dioxygenase ferredoxin reductase subunit